MTTESWQDRAAVSGTMPSLNEISVALEQRLRKQTGDEVLFYATSRAFKARGPTGLSAQAACSAKIVPSAGRSHPIRLFRERRARALAADA